MIHVYGTSHVSRESIELIEEKIEKHEPDIIALELDPKRLEALLTDKKRSGGSLFARLLKKFQDRIGSKTGVMPGEEMLHAYKIAAERNAEVALIDQDIAVTLSRLRQVPRKEKARAVFDLLLGMLFSGKFDYSKIPDEEEVQKLLGELEWRYPSIYRVLVEERNNYMVASLEKLREDRDEAVVVAFVGAAHRRDIVTMLRNDEEQVSG